MVSVKEKVAYGLGDTASNIIFQTVMLFLTYFYTDVFGLAPAAVGTMFLLVRLVDAVTDPIMGALADRTRTRWGAYRPYLLWLAIPFAVCSVLAFTTPDLNDGNKLIYAYVTYGLLMVAYTAINIPYCALGGVLSSDPSERVSIQSYRFVFGMSGGLIVSLLTFELVQYFGQGDNALGYQYTMIAMSALGILMFWACFAGTRERVPPANDIMPTMGSQLKGLWLNDQWRVLSVAAIILLTGMVLRTSLAIYYVKYYLARPDLVTLFVTVGMIGNILGCSLATKLTRHMCKIKAYMTLQVIASVFSALAYLVLPGQLTLAFVLYFFWCFFLQMATPILWAKIADTVDYGHWKTGVRITGVTYSSVVFFIKLGLALGGAATGWCLAFYGYDASQQIVSETLEGIRISFTLYPAIATLLVAFVIRFYTLNTARVGDIQQALALNGVTSRQV